MNNSVKFMLNSLLQTVGLLDHMASEQKSYIDIIQNNDFKNNMQSMETQYQALTQRERHEFYFIINEEFGNDFSMLLYLYSLLLISIKKIEILEIIVDAICKGREDVFLNVFLELQIAAEISNIKLNGAIYPLRRKLHSHNVNQFLELMNFSKEYIPYNQRNQNRIVVVAEQILSDKHAPTKVVLDQCRALQNSMHMEVLLIVCPIHCNVTSNDLYWFHLQNDNYLPSLNGNLRVVYENGSVTIHKENLDEDIIIHYKGCTIKAKQILFAKDSLIMLRNLMETIYKYNPMFIYNMGSIHPLADACSSFTTVVSCGMGYGYPVSEGQILLEYIPRSESEGNNINNILWNPYNQLIIKDTFNFNVEPPENPHSRTMYEIPEDRFVIAIAGNRLEKELTEGFIKYLSKVCLLDDRIAIVLIGSYPEYQKVFKNPIFKNRIHYMGYQNSFIDAITVADIYLNPPRKGGGTSALIALCAGVPVVTLPDCDVAGNVRNEFICKDMDCMLDMIQKYLVDKEYYNSQKQIGIKYVAELTDIDSYMKTKIDKIKKAIEYLEGSK